MILRNRKLGSPSFEKGGNRVGEVENHSAPDFFPVEENRISQSNSLRRIPSMMRMDNEELDNQDDVTSLKNKIRKLEEALTRAKSRNDTSLVRNIVHDQGDNGTKFDGAIAFSQTVMVSLPMMAEMAQMTVIAIPQTVTKMVSIPMKAERAQIMLKAAIANK